MIQLERISIPQKGWNTVLPERELPYQYAPILQNFAYTSQASIVRRPACVQLANVTPPDAGTIVNVFEHKDIGGAQSVFVATSLGNVYPYNMATNTYGTAALTGYGSNIHAASLGNLLVVGDGFKPAMKFNGTSWSAITTPPTAPFNNAIGSIFTTHKGRMYAAGLSGRGMDVLHSATIGGGASGADYWSATLSGVNQGGFIDCTGDLPQGDTITGLASYKDFIIVFLSNNILVYTTTEGASGLEATLYRRIAGIGCIGHDTIASVGNDIVFLSKDGFKSIQEIAVQGGASAFSESDPVQDFVRKTVNVPSVVAKALYLADIGAYICDVNGFIFVYYDGFKAWVYWNSMPMPHIVLSDSTALFGNSRLSKLDDTVFQDTHTGSNGIYTSRWKMAPIRLNNLNARWNALEVIADSQSGIDLTINAYTDFSLQFDTYSLHIQGTNIAAKTPLVGRGEYISFDISTNATTDLEIRGVEVYFNANNARSAP